MGDTCDGDDDHLCRAVGEQLLGGCDRSACASRPCFAAAGTIVRVDSPPRPHVISDVGHRHTVEASVVEFDPTLVDLVRHPERLCRLASAQQRRADHPIGLVEPLGDAGDLGEPDIVERKVEQTLQLPAALASVRP